MKKPMQSRAEQRMSKLNSSARKKVHQSGGEKGCISAVTEKSIWNLMCGRKEVLLCSIVLSFFFPHTTCSDPLCFYAIAQKRSQSDWFHWFPLEKIQPQTSRSLPMGGLTMMSCNGV